MICEEQKSLVPGTSPDYQEKAFHIDSAVVNRLKMLNFHQSLPSTAITRRLRRLKKLRTCGSLKRKQSFVQESSSKKAAGATAVDFALQEMWKNSSALNALNQESTSQMQGTFKNPDDVQVSQDDSASQPILRSISDPVLSNHQPGELNTPSRPQEVLQRRNSDQETPNSKKLRKLKETMEEMRRWMEEVVQDEDEDTTHLQNDNIKEQDGNETKESVFVDKTEGGLILQFNCPCGSGYEIYLSGDKCFYRLI